MPLPPTDTEDASCQPCPVACEPVFDRVSVSYHIRGGTRVAWELLPTFTDPTPHTFTLQVGTSGLGRTDVEEFEDVGLPVEDGFYAIDSEQRAWGKDNRVVYRVKLETGGSGSPYYSLPTGGMGILSRRDWQIARQVVRDRLQRYKRSVSDGYFLKRRWTGRPCTRCLDFQTKEIKDADCPVCLGTGFVCGYYRPMSCSWAKLPPRGHRTELEPQRRGTINDVVLQGVEMLAMPLLGEEDVWIDRKTDDRYYIHQVQHTVEIRTVPIIASVEFRLAPFTSVVYGIELPTDMEALEEPR